MKEEQCKQTSCMNLAHKCQRNEGPGITVHPSNSLCHPHASELQVFVSIALCPNGWISTQLPTLDVQMTFVPERVCCGHSLLCYFTSLLKQLQAFFKHLKIAVVSDNAVKHCM